MITVVLWRWGKKYTKDHVALMQSMLSRHLSVPHRIVCLTDQPYDLPDGVEAADLPKPVRGGERKCMRRLWIYSQKAAKLGARLFQLDLDMVIVGSIDALVTRPEPCVVWKSDSNVVHGYGYNPSVLLMTPGARRDVWDTYAANPKRVERDAEQAGWWAMTNSDQGVASYLLQANPPATFTAADGVLAYRVFAGKRGQRGRTLPAGARIVSFHGPRDPSDRALQQQSPWILEHWA